MLALVACAACNRPPESTQIQPATAARPVLAKVLPARVVPEPDPPTLVLPGAFAPDTTLAQLQQRFGKANVQVGEVPGAEGETSRGVVLFPGDPARLAYLYFQDAQTLTGLSMVRVFGPVSRWTLDDGIGIGTPLSEVLRRNGKPIRFYGFDWDYGGTITDWNGGKLAPRDNDPVRQLISLGSREGADAGAYPLGDSEYSSDDPRYPKLGASAVVNEIGVSFPGEDDL